MDMAGLLARASENFAVCRSFGSAHEKDGVLSWQATMYG